MTGLRELWSSSAAVPQMDTNEEIYFSVVTYWGAIIANNSNNICKGFLVRRKIPAF
jgi:hypothetical protein